MNNDCTVVTVLQDVLETVLALGLEPVIEFCELEYSVDLALPRQRIAIEVFIATDLSIVREWITVPSTLDPQHARSKNLNVLNKVIRTQDTRNENLYLYEIWMFCEPLIWHCPLPSTTC